MSSPFTRQEFTDMCDMRLVLEGAATRWAPVHAAMCAHLAAARKRHLPVFV